MSFGTRSAGQVWLLAALCATSHAAVTGIDVTERGAVANGMSFGRGGSYEYIIGKAHFAADPKAPQNRIVADISLAPKNAQKAVEYSADIFVLRPKDPAKGNGTVLTEVSNRGGKSLAGVFDFAKGTFDPKAQASVGDGFLLEQGFTLAWIGWEFDVPAKPGLLRAYVPVAREGNKAITGIIRAEWTGTRATDVISTGDQAQVGYPVLDAKSAKNRLLVRGDILAKRRAIPAAQWHFVDASHVKLEGGFQPGLLYEVIYETANPPVAGLGMAGMRDFVSYLKYGGVRTVFSGSETSLRHAIAFGVSQSGRYLREYLYDGFNQDEHGRKVFDGVWAHVAGAGRGSFNGRFAQPSRDGQEFANVFYPVDVPPFDEETLLEKAHKEHAVPKLFFTNGSYEYWSRCASLIHTTADGKTDVAPSANTRIYFFAGSQHTVGGIPEARVDKARAQITQNQPNVNDYRYALRALLLAMQNWVDKGAEPPESRLPLLEKGQLTTLADLRFPRVDTFNVPEHKREAYRLDFSEEPPKIGKAFPTFVPQVDANGNEMGGIKMPEIATPLASYTGWNLRAASIGSPQGLVSFIGSWIPLPSGADMASAHRDSRATVDKLYANEQDYLSKIDKAGEELVRARLLLKEDLEALHHRAEREWSFYHEQIRP